MDDRARGVTVADAAVQLGISKEAVRKRIHRGTLSSHRDADGMVRVSIPPSSTASSTDPELIEAKDETIRVLQEQLEAEREARLRADHIIARLSESNAELSRTVRELEPADRPQEPSEDAAQQPTSKEPEPGPGPSSVGYFGKRFRIVEPPGPGPSPRRTLAERLRALWKG